MYDDLVDRLRNLSHFEIRNAESVIHVSAEAVTELREIAKEAADAIERLERRENDWEKLCAAWQKRYDGEQRWIPVTERLPKEGDFVLVYGDLYPNKHDGGVIAVSTRMDWNYWQGFGRERDITHWMPLPEPPKGEKE